MTYPQQIDALAFLKRYQVIRLALGLHAIYYSVLSPHLWLIESFWQRLLWFYPLPIAHSHRAIHRHFEVYLHWLLAYHRTPVSMHVHRYELLSIFKYLAFSINVTSVLLLLPFIHSIKFPLPEQYTNMGNMVHPHLY